MKESIILDRAYAYYLIDFVRDLETGTVGTSPNADEINAIAWSAMLFDRVLLEDQFASGFLRYIQPNAWFADTFEICPSGSILRSHAELSAQLDKEIEKSLENRKLKKIIRSDLPKRYRTQKSRESLLEGIHRTIAVAQLTNSAILPFPGKIGLYQALMGDEGLHHQHSDAAEVMQEMFQVEAPAFRIDSIDRLLQVRGDRRVVALRDKIWERCQIDRGVRMDLRSEITAIKNDLLMDREPSAGKALVKALLGSTIPGPSAFAEGLMYLIDKYRAGSHDWLLLLVSLERATR